MGVGEVGDPPGSRLVSAPCRGAAYRGSQGTEDSHGFAHLLGQACPPWIGATHLALGF